MDSSLLWASRVLAWPEEAPSLRRPPPSLNTPTITPPPHPQDNYFFALSKYQEPLAELIGGTEFVQPASRRNEVRGCPWGLQPETAHSSVREHHQAPIPRPPPKALA